MMTGWDSTLLSWYGLLNDGILLPRIDLARIVELRRDAMSSGMIFDGLLNDRILLPRIDLARIFELRHDAMLSGMIL
jgi:hypothetical protein